VSPRLPGIALDHRIEVVATGPELGRRFGGHDAILLAVPAQSLRAAALVLGPSITRGTPVIACAKGIERGTRKFMTDVIAECLPLARPAVLSGPSFAADVARGLPTAVTLALENSALENSALEDGGDAAKLAAALGSASFRPYHTTDIRGVEIGGAAKNVLAIAAGIVTGRGLGASAAAALTTRGFAELFRFGKAFGARPETLTGLSGLGDLVLTCSSPQSRNFELGIRLGKGEPIGATQIGATQNEPKLVEGAATAPVLVEMAQSKGVEMPIANAVAAILAGRASIAEAIENLLTRPFRAEG
jgi:glycerol-3-phosphate dehydrogenase (NAD(P)+)